MILSHLYVSKFHLLFCFQTAQAHEIQLQRVSLGLIILLIKLKDSSLHDLHISPICMLSLLRVVSEDSRLPLTELDHFPFCCICQEAVWNLSAALYLWTITAITFVCVTNILWIWIFIAMVIVGKQKKNSRVLFCTLFLKTSTICLVINFYMSKTSYCIWILNTIHI